MAALSCLVSWAGALPIARAADATALPSAPRHAIQGAVGLGADAVREDLLVPLGFAGPRGRLSLGYRGLIKSSELEVRGDLGMAVLFNRFGHSGVAGDHSLSASWSWPVMQRETSLLSMGPVLVHESRVNFLESWDDAHGYWIGADWLGPYARYERKWAPRWRLEGAVGVALVGYVGRPPSYRYNKQDAMNHLDYWFVQPYRHANLEAFWNLQALHLDLALRRTSDPLGTPGHGWIVGGELRLLRATEPAMAIGMNLNVYLGHAWGL